MPACVVVAMLITCTNLHPSTPDAAAKVLTSSIRPWTPPAPRTGLAASYVPRTPSRWEPFDGPPSPTRPLSEPWSVSTYSKDGVVATFFNGQQTVGVPLAYGGVPLIYAVPPTK